LTGATTLTVLDLASLVLLAALALLWFAARRLSPHRQRGSRPAKVTMGTETLARYRPADFVALVDPAAAPLTPSGLSRSGRSLPLRFQVLAHGSTSSAFSNRVVHVGR